MTRQERGLTLIEVLVASALLGVFFVSVYSIVAGMLKERTMIEEDATPFAVGPVVMDRVVEDLRGAVLEPYKDFDALKAENLSMGGETCTTVDFVTTTPSRARVKVQRDYVKARINEVGYRLRRSETAQNLSALYRREDLGVDEEPLAGGMYYKLADRVKAFRIDWFAEDPGDPATEDGKGEDTWDAKKEKKLPFSCRITLTLVGDSEVDDRGRAAEGAPEYTFVSYVVFGSRHDKPDQAKQP